jgi:signal transduction histidine kinase
MSADVSNSPEVADLRRTVAQLEAATKVLVRRDLELKRAYRALQEIDERKSEFVSIAAHQLRTPLSAIRWGLQMLLDGEVDTLTHEQTVVVEQAQTSIVKMVALVNDLLSADHLEYDKVKYNFQSIHMGRLIVEIVDELLPMAQERGITINVDTITVVPTISGDAMRLKEALLNILNNAIKYSFSGGIVTISLKTVADQAQISITDFGIGIPKEYHDRLFKKFTRADNARRVDADGSGLGMFIAKKVVEAHGGTLTFSSVEGQKTVFTATLPINT